MTRPNPPRPNARGRPRASVARVGKERRETLTLTINTNHPVSPRRVRQLILAMAPAEKQPVRIVIVGKPEGVRADRARAIARRNIESLGAAVET